MLKELTKKPLFWCGFLFIFIWLAGSIVYLLVWHNHIPIADLALNSNGKILAKPPYSPLVQPPLGADDFARSIFIVVLIGAKFTLGFAILIALMRVVLSGIFGIAMRLYIPRIGRIILTPFESLSYFPIALLGFLILQWALFNDARIHEGHFSYGFWARTLIYVIVLTFISLPTTTQTIFNETENVLQREFIDSAKILGGSKFHLFWVHIKPFLLPRLLLVFIREIVQVLLVMAHLGVFNIGIGGILMKQSLFSTGVPPKLYPYSLSNDWAGLIGIYWHFLWTTYPYIAFIPIILVTLAILSVKGILVSFQSIIEKEDRLSSTGKRKWKEEDEREIHSQINHLSFEPIGKTGA